MSPAQPTQRFLPFLWRRKWMVLALTAIGGAALFATASYLPKRYRSEALILVVPQQVPQRYVPSTVTMTLADRLTTIKQMIMSRTRLEQVIKQMDLYATERETQIMEDIIERMRREILVTTVRADAFAVSYEGTDPRTVQNVAEKLAGLFINESMSDRERLTEGTNAFMEQQVATARVRLMEHEKQMSEIQNRHQTVPPIMLMDYELLKNQYRDLFTKKEESNISANLERRQIGEQFRLLDPARIPEQPFSPKRTQLTIYGALGGLALSLATVSVAYARQRAA